MEDLQAMFEAPLQSAATHMCAMYLTDSQASECTQWRTLSIRAQLIGCVRLAGMIPRLHREEAGSTPEMCADFRLQSLGAEYRIGYEHASCFEHMLTSVKPRS